MAPGSLITIDNERDLTCGHMQNVRVGAALGTGEVSLVADLHVKDGDLIDKIDAGIRDVSCGYTYILKRLANGTFIQTNIRGNHIAVVPQGRAGADISIQDSALTDSAPKEKSMNASPQLEELIEDTDVSDLVNSDGGIDDVIARMNGGRSAATGRGCFDGAPRGVPSTAAVDRALSSRLFDGMPYSVVRLAMMVLSRWTPTSAARGSVAQQETGVYPEAKIDSPVEGCTGRNP
jgi:Uncharacterized protein conserved in bacteria (DUF2213)